MVSFNCQFDTMQTICEERISSRDFLDQIGLVGMSVGDYLDCLHNMERPTQKVGGTILD